MDAIKLDRQFFNEIASPKGQTIIANFLSPGQKLGIHTVTEGIEDPGAGGLSPRVDCDMIPGLLFLQAPLHSGV